MTKKVVLLNVQYPHYETEKRVLEPLGAELSPIVTGDDLGASIEAARFADAVMTRETKLPRAFIEALERCKVIVRYGVGVDNIDLEAAKERRIYVANVGDYGTETVADHAIALMYAVARRIARRDRDVRNGAWDIGAREPLLSLDGKVLGVAGCGKIGRAFIRKCSCLGFAKILGYDPFAQNIEGVEMTSLDALLRNADFISLHMPLTPNTVHMLNEKTLAVMKPGAVIVNTSRGGLIKQDDLAEALRRNRIFGAGIDVFEQEAPAKDNPLFSLENVVVSDHTGWYSVESLEKLQYKAAMEAARVFKNEAPESWVNRWD
jgi:D-3-phosphoglycerate dehydrogenase